MEHMTLKDFNKWIEENPTELTNNVCNICGRRTDKCHFCNQPERLSEMAPQGEAIV